MAEASRGSEHRLARGTFLLVLANVGILITGYVIHLGAGRWFGPSKYGTFGVVLTLLGLVEILVISGIPQSVTKFIAEDERLAYSVRRTALKLQMSFAFVVFLVYFVSAQFIAELLNDPALTDYIRLSALDIPLYALFTFYVGGLMGGLREFSKQAWIMAVYATAKVGFVFSFVVMGFGLNGAVLGYVAASGLGSIIAILSCKMKTLEFRFESSKIVRFAIPMIFFSLSLTALMSLDLLFVQNIIANADETGYYTSSMVTARLPYYLATALAITLLPSVSGSIAKKDDGQTRDYISESLRYLLILLLPTVALVSATSGELLSLVYSSAYVPGGDSLAILVFGLMFLSVFVVLSMVITASGRPFMSMAFAVVLIPVDVVLNFALIPLYGLSGAAIATTATAFLGMLVASSYVLRSFKALVTPLSVGKVVIGSAVIYLIAHFYPVSGLALILVYVLLLLVYSGILYALKEIKKQDVLLVKRMLFGIGGLR